MRILMFIFSAIIISNVNKPIDKIQDLCVCEKKLESKQYKDLKGIVQMIEKQQIQRQPAIIVNYN